MKLYDTGVYLLNGQKIVPENQADFPVSKEEAAKSTIAYSILKAHNTSGNMEKLQIKFDKLTSHDITFVGIIQTARASGLEKFPVPYVLTNCHNSLCAVGGTINEDDHMFGLTCAKKYGGVYVPPHQAVIHQFAREMLAAGGKMILGSDSHTRYGALGTMAMGEGGPELVKQLLSQTYDINMPGVVAIYLTGSPRPGVGPQDVALAIIGKVFANGYVKNKVMEFVGPGVANLSADFRIGVDVMTTETTCLSSIWQTDEKIQEFYEIHGRSEDYKELKPGETAYYDGCVEIDLSEIRPMIAMPFHPSNTYTIDELKANLAILDFGTFAVREVSGRMTDTECIICRSIPCTKARSAKSSLHNSSRFKKSCQNAILSQFHINRSTCRIYTQCEGICTNALAFKDISCCTDIFKSTTCTSCDDSLFYIKFTINYFVS